MKNEDQLYAELASLFFAMKQAIRAKLPQKDHADPRAWMRCEVLRFIGEVEQPSMQDIAKHLRVTAPSATSMIRKLNRMGWVERKAFPSDKRTTRIVLSKKGKKELQRYYARSAALMKKVFANLPERDVRELRRVLASLNQSASEERS